MSTMSSMSGLSGMRGTSGLCGMSGMNGMSGMSGMSGKPLPGQPHLLPLPMQQTLPPASIALSSLRQWGFFSSCRFFHPLWGWP